MQGNYRKNAKSATLMYNIYPMFKRGLNPNYSINDIEYFFLWLTEQISKIFIEIGYF